ncbi:MAG: PQ-loop domain-containing transporter [Bacteroidota bacterium]
MIDWIGWIGFGILVGAWVPQTLETIQNGYFRGNTLFILMYVTSSFLLAVHSYIIDDAVFLALNTLLTLGSGMNLYYKMFPRVAPPQPEE